MIKSMTGFGSARGSAAGFDITVELKSVNNKFLETSVKIPRSFMFAEERVKKTVSGHISRGKVDVFINISAVEADNVKVAVNRPLLRSYLEALKAISEENALPLELTALELARFPEVLSVERSELDTEAISGAIVSVTEEALKDFDAMRLREGEKLREDVLSKLSAIEEYVSVVEAASPETEKQYRERLEQKLRELLGDGGTDEGRIIQETAIFADRIAVDEETVRLRSHISQLKTMLDGGSPIGRKIDFLIQEFNREANTIGSKCQNSGIAHTVVNLKSEIEKIREQIQNIE